MDNIVESDTKGIYFVQCKFSFLLFLQFHIFHFFFHLILSISFSLLQKNKKETSLFLLSSCYKHMQKLYICFRHIGALFYPPRLFMHHAVPFNNLDQVHHPTMGPIMITQVLGLTNITIIVMLFYSSLFSSFSIILCMIGYLETLLAYYT